MAEGLTPLTTRLGAAWLSLRTRWLYWLLVATFAMACGGFAMQVDRQRSESPRMSPVVSFPRKVKPEATTGGQKRDRDVAPGEARSLQVFASLAQWSQTGAFATLPKVECIEMYTPATGDGLRWLAAQPKLRALSLLTTSDQSAADLSQLGASSSLRHLRVLESAGYRTDEPIAWPPNLEVVDLQGAHALSLQRLEELRRLPNLHTLAVRLHPTHPSSQLPDDVLATLKSFPALRRLYLLEMPEAFPNLVQETQQSLPGLWVRPSTFDKRRAEQVPGMCLVVGLWMAILGVMLSPQFVAPQSVLLPGYRAPHSAVIGALFMVGMGAVIGLLRYAGLDLLTAGGLCGGALTICGLLSALMRRIDPGVPGFTQPFLAFPVFVFVWPVVLAILWWSSGEFDWFLRGEWPGLSAGLILIGGLLTADMAGWLTTLARRVEEFGKGGCPLGMDFQAWQVWAMTAAQHRKRQEWQFWLTGLDQRLNALSPGAPLDSRSRRRLWVAGSMVTPLRAALFMLAITVATFGGFAIVAYLADDLPNLDPKLLVGGFVYSAVMTMYLPAVYKYLRRPYYSVELLRPVSRTDWVRDWFTLSAYELAIPLGLVIAGAVVGWGLQIWPVPATAYWLPLALLGGGSFFILWAAELWLLTYHWSAIAAAFGLAIIACVMFGLSISSNRFAFEAWLQSLTGVWTLAVGSVLLGAALTYGARRRWMTWELAA